MKSKYPLISMTHFVVKFAGLVITIDTDSSGTYGYCINYLSREEPMFDVCVRQEDIEREVNQFGATSEHLNKPFLETIAVYKKIAEKALDFNTFLMHGAVIASNDSSYMFTASSGTGKTTHIKLWLKNLPDSFVVNGDKPFIKIIETGAIACGTPWSGKERMGTNTMVPLKSIVIMERAEDNQIEEIPFAIAYPFLLQQTYIPEDPDKARKTLNLIASLYSKVRIYKFRFNNMKDDCFDVAYKALVGELHTAGIDNQLLPGLK